MEINWEKMNQIIVREEAINREFDAPPPTNYELASAYLSEIEGKKRLEIIYECNGGREKSRRLSTIFCVRNATKAIEQEIERRFN